MSGRIPGLSWARGARGIEKYSESAHQGFPLGEKKYVEWSFDTPLSFSGCVFTHVRTCVGASENVSVDPTLAA